MARRSTQPIQGQEALFVGGNTGVEHAAGYHDWQALEENPELKTSFGAVDPNAVAVDIETRARYLTDALTDFGKINQRRALPIVQITPPLDSDLYARYARRTDQVVEGAQRRVDEEFIPAVKSNFWKATGYSALRGAKPQLMAPEDIKVHAVDDWRNFEARFAGVPNSKRRQQFKRNLAKQITAQKRLKKKLQSPGS